jgi:uncharacterized protein YbjT (DUF2867 family)
VVENKAGASGAIGSALVDRLVASGLQPLVAGRRPERLRSRWPSLEARELDALDPASIERAVRGVDVLYYLIHSMEAGSSAFDERDRRAATNVARAALDAGVGRIVYLGGLGEDDEALSQHLESRHEVGRALAASGPPVLELRAAMVIGPTSASFRMLADLVERLPVMVLPKWVDTESQPIALTDVVAYLDAARDVPVEEHHTVVGIGGADVVTYRQMLETYAELRGKRRVLLGVPLLTPHLSSLWCGLVTSVDEHVARPLIDGMVHDMTVTDDAATQLFPDVSPMGFEDAIRSTLAAR